MMDSENVPDPAQRTSNVAWYLGVAAACVLAAFAACVILFYVRVQMAQAQLTAQMLTQLPVMLTQTALTPVPAGGSTVVTFPLGHDSFP